MRKFFNTTPIPTIVSGILQVTAGVLLSGGHALAAQIAALAAYALAGSDIPRFSSRLQFFMCIAASVVLGQSIEYGSGNFPLMTIATFLCMMSILSRVIFYGSMLHTRLLWADPLIYISGFACYVTANLLYHYSWQGWVFPVPAFLFSLKLVIAFITEDKAYAKANASGYRARVGMPAPDFSLPDQDGNMVQLSDFKDKRHVLLLFVRGDWCPACHMMLRAYERGRKKFMAKNVFLLAIGPDSAGVNRDMAERIGVDYRILADDHQQASRMYGVYLDKDPVARKTNIADGGLPLPASFLVSADGIVRYHSSPERVGEFLNPSLVFDVLEKI